MNTWINTLLFGYYPYICMTVFLLGSWIRFDRDQYSWKSDTSQILRNDPKLRWGSFLFHVGILFIFFGHFFGLLTPSFVYSWLITPGQKQLLAMTTGGIAGLMVLVGLSLLLYRRMSDARVRKHTKTSDMVVLWFFWVQVILGLLTIPLAAQHMDGSVMEVLVGWAQRITTFRPDAASYLLGVSWVFKLHILLGMTIFLIFPFTRLVHVWSGFASLAYVLRPYQLVRDRRLNVVARQEAAQRRLMD